MVLVCTSSRLYVRSMDGEFCMCEGTLPATVYNPVPPCFFVRYSRSGL